MQFLNGVGILIVDPSVSAAAAASASAPVSNTVVEAALVGKKPHVNDEKVKLNVFSPTLVIAGTVIMTICHMQML